MLKTSGNLKYVETFSFTVWSVMNIKTFTSPSSYISTQFAIELKQLMMIKKCPFAFVKKIVT